MPTRVTVTGEPGSSAAISPSGWSRPESGSRLSTTSREVVGNGFISTLTLHGSRDAEKRSADRRDEGSPEHLLVVDEVTARSRRGRVLHRRLAVVALSHGRCPVGVGRSASSGASDEPSSHTITSRGDAICRAGYARAHFIPMTRAPTVFLDAMTCPSASTLCNQLSVLRAPKGSTRSSGHFASPSLACPGLLASSTRRAGDFPKARRSLRRSPSGCAAAARNPHGARLVSFPTGVPTSRPAARAVSPRWRSCERTPRS